VFQSILADLLGRVQGAEWAMVVGVDGVVLETTPASPGDFSELRAAVYATFVRACQRAALESRVGDLEGSIVFAARTKILIEMLTPEYFLLFGLSNDGNTGHARFEITRARDLLERELTY